ncbi:MAG: pyruvate formate lyase family protein, partial [Desulfobacterales bacterium]
EFREIAAYWKGKTMVDEIARRREEQGLTEKAYGSPEIPFVYFSSEQGHVVLGTEKVVREGFGGLKARAVEGMARRDREMRDASESRRASLEEEIDFLKAVVICCEAAIAFSHRYAALAREKAETTSDYNRKKQYLVIADICEHVPEHPAETFRQALQSIWFTECIGSITGQHGFSPGRIDQYLGQFYEREIASGELSRDEAMEYIEEFFLKLNDPFQDVIIGGVNRQGKDASNDVSYLIIDAYERCHPVQNNLCVRLHADTPREFLIRACEVFRRTSGIAFYNDDVVIPALIDRGTAPEDAWDYGAAGCVELAECGTANPNGASGGINLAGMVELALNNGHPRDPSHNKGQGAPTGDPREFKCFEDVMDAVKAQVTHTWERMVPFMDLKDACFKDILPTPFVSTITDDCIARGKDFTAGGPRYNNSGVYIQGPATAFDSLMAIKKLVFDDKVFTMDELLTLLETNFEGAEDKRLVLVNRGPKFGNDDDDDAVACDLFNFVCDMINETPRPPVGTYTAGSLTAAGMVGLGRFLGATPDGRKAGASISNSLSPSNGAERSGLTAALRSMAKLDQRRMRNCVAYNPSIHPSCLEGEATEKFADLLATYFDMGGLQIQPNVVSTETLRDAQKHPEDHRHLTVKVSGFSALFTELHESIQNDIIARTALRA